MKKYEKIILSAVVASTLVLLASDLDISAGTTNTIQEVRDPMVKYQVKENSQETTIDENKIQLIDNVSKIKDIISQCKIDGIAVSGERKFVVINDSIIEEGDCIMPDSKIKINNISINRIIFCLGESKVEYMFNTIEAEDK